MFKAGKCHALLSRTLCHSPSISR